MEQARATQQRFVRLEGGTRWQRGTLRWLPLGWDEERGRAHLPPPPRYSLERAIKHEERYLASLETEKPTVKIAPAGAIQQEWKQLHDQTELKRKRARKEEDEKSLAFISREGRERERGNEQEKEQLRTDEEMARKLTRTWAASVPPGRHLEQCTAAAGTDVAVPNGGRNHGAVPDAPAFPDAAQAGRTYSGGEDSDDV